MSIHRWILRVAARPMPREYGAAMEETLARRLAAARAAGTRRYWRVWCRELSGLVALAVTERWGARARAVRRAARRRNEQRKAGAMDAIVLEIAHAARRLRRTPAFTLASLLTLALAIGANGAIFAVVERVVVNPLPYPASDRLIELDHGAERLNLPAGMGNTSGLYFHYVERSRALESAAVYRPEELTLTGHGDPARLRVARVTPSLASVLRVGPALGRWFTEAEGLPGGPPVVVLSHGLWVRSFGGDPGVVGKAVALDGLDAQIVGVMPASYTFPSPNVDLWAPLQLSRAAGFGLWNYMGVARLRDGVALEHARAELKGLIADIPNAFPGDQFALGNAQTNLRFSGRTLKEATIGNVARGLWMLLGSVGVILLVACANVANLFLVRSEARQREVAVRRALGAGRLRMARYFLIESLLLSTVAASLGLGLAWGALRLLVLAEPVNLPRLHEIRLDAVTLAFTLALGLVAALTFGALPVWRGTDAAGALNESGRGNTLTRRRHVFRHVLMGAQVALALVLLVASGLIVRSFQKLRTVDAGFDPASALTFNVAWPDREYRSRDEVVAAHHAVIDRLSALPGVMRVSATTCLPLSGGCSGNTVRVEGRTYQGGTVPPLAFFRAVAGGYFETMGMRLLRGRTIARGDVARGEPVAVVNETLVARFFPNEDPIGRRIASNIPPARPGEAPTFTWLEIVGVVSNTPWRALAERDPMPQVYLPMSIARGPDSARAPAIGPGISVMTYVVRTATPPLVFTASARQAVSVVDATVPIAQVRALHELVDRSSAQMAFTMVLVAIAAGVALLLGAIGVYGVMGYVVSQRTSEIGVRLALGATPARVAGQVLRQGAAVALAGVAAGLVAALAGSRLIESLLYDVSPRDPLIFTVTATSLLAVALLACWLPARRAARTNPLSALRAE